jgi:hypothetical protein
MFTRWKKLQEELGLGSALSYLCSKFLRKINSQFDLHHSRFYAQPVCQRARVSAKRRALYQFEIMEKYSSVLKPLNRSKQVLDMRFKQGAICLVVKKDDVFVGCIWLLRNQYSEDQFRAIYQFNNNMVWDFDAFILPQKRLTPAFAVLWDRVDEWMEEHNIDFSLSRISAYNTSSIHSHQSAGANPIGWALTIVLSNWQISIASIKPKLHLSFSSAALGPKWIFESKLVNDVKRSQSVARFDKVKSSSDARSRKVMKNRRLEE